MNVVMLYKVLKLLCVLFSNAFLSHLYRYTGLTSLIFPKVSASSIK